MAFYNPIILTRNSLTNVLKLDYPCSCHLSPFESEFYRAIFTPRDSNEHPQIAASVKVSCSNCNQSRTFDVDGRWISEYDVGNL